MNSDNKHFFVFCYLQNINPSQEAWSLYETYYKPEFKNITAVYKSIKAVLDYDLKTHVKKTCPTLIEGTYTFIDNGLDIKLQHIPFDSEIKVDTSIYKVSKDYQGNAIISFKDQYDLKHSLTFDLKVLKRAVEYIERINPFTYKQLFTLPAIRSVTHLTSNTFKALEMDYYDYWDYFSVFEDLTIDGFICNTLFEHNTYCSTTTLKVVTYKDQPLMLLSTYTDTDPLVTIFNKELYEELRQYVFRLFISLEKSNPWVEDINKSFCPRYSWDLKGKCF